jgi:thiamine-phosphate diphosphorylase
MKNHSSVPAHLLRARLRGLYVITEAPLDAHTDHERIARAAIAGGARLLQLRDKSTPPEPLLAIANRLRVLTRRAGVLFIINDRPDLALACDVDGVHLGPNDLPICAARKILGPHALIGVSCGDASEAQSAEKLGADYIGVGAIFSTQTKLDAGAPIGLENLKAIRAATILPIAAIGGISAANIDGVLSCGAAMACVVSAISRAGDETQMLAATRVLSSHFEARP